MKDPTTETETLKPCPFCGNPANMQGGGPIGWSIGCRSAFIPHGQSGYFDCAIRPCVVLQATRGKAIEAWNTRPATMEDRALDALGECRSAMLGKVRPDNPAWATTSALLREAGRVG